MSILGSQFYALNFFLRVFNLFNKITLQRKRNQLQMLYDDSTFGLKNIRKVICEGPLQTLKTRRLEDL